MTERAPPRPPWVYRLVRDSSGQSETIGVLLLLAVTVIGAIGVVAFGSQALNDTESASTDQRNEHTMTLFDSRAAVVALGDSNSQSVEFSSSSQGEYTVKEDAGWIAIEHYNYSGNNNTEEIYNESLGALVYENGDTEMAYQGGGVWRGTNDSARMVSPPEFHYRGATLTLPVIHVRGNTSAAGNVNARVTSTGEHDRIFRNASASYSATGDPYVNPVENGTVNVTIHSQYYEAWGEYFRQRSDAAVTTYDNNQTVTIKLLTLGGVLGDFEMPAEGGTLPVVGMADGHVTDNFTVTLKVDQWSNSYFSFHADEGNQELELNINLESGTSCSELSGASPSRDVHLSIYYNNGSSLNQEWDNGSVPVGDDSVNPDLSVDCSADTLTVNLTGTATDLAYEDISGLSNCSNNNANNNNCKWEFGASIDGDNNGPNTIQFDEHDADTSTIYTDDAGDTANMSYLVNHYFALMGPQFDLIVSEGPGNSDRVLNDQSEGTLQYDQGEGQYLTYLHVTENNVTVTLE